MSRLGHDFNEQMSIFPGVNHGSWDRAYREEKLAEWLLEQKKD